TLAKYRAGRGPRTEKTTHLLLAIAKQAENWPRCQSVLKTVRLCHNLSSLNQEGVMSGSADTRDRGRPSSRSPTHQIWQFEARRTASSKPAQAETPLRERLHESES